MPSRPQIRRRAIALVAAVLVTSAVPATAGRADLSLADLSLDELMDLEVTLVSRRPQPASRTAAALTVLTGDELRQLGVRNLPDALRLVPGFQVGRVDANKWVVTSRGFAGLFSNKLLVLVDGRSVYSPLFNGVFWESQDVLMQNIDRIEVIRGPGGALWGANAVNGVVNVVTRPAAASTHVQAGAGGERRQVAVQQGWQLDGGAVRLDLERFDVGRSEPATGLGVRDDWHMQRLGVRTDLEREDDRLMLAANVRRGAVGQSVTYVARVEPAQTRYFDAEILAVDLVGRLSRSWSEDRQFTAQMSYDLFDREEDVLHGRIQTADLDVQHRFRTGAHRWVWGGRYRRIWDDYDGTFTMWVEPSSRTTHLLSGFVHDEVEMASGRVALSGGTKVEHNGFTGWEWQPSLRLWAAPRPALSVWGAVNRAVRTPSRGDHDFMAAVGYVPADSVTAGSPELVLTLFGRDDVVAEEMIAVDAGLRARFSASLHIDVAAFHYEYDDLLTQEAGLPLLSERTTPPHWIAPVRAANGASATTQGVELTADWSPTPDWQVRGFGTLFRLDNELHEGSTSISEDPYENDSPSHQLGLRVVHQRGAWTLAGSGRYVGKLPGPLPDIPAYATADLRIARRWSSGLELALTGYGLLDATHREAVSNAVGAVHTRVERELFLTISWDR